MKAVIMYLQQLSNNASFKVSSFDSLFELLKNKICFCLLEDAGKL